MQDIVSIFPQRFFSADSRQEMPATAAGRAPVNQSFAYYDLDRIYKLSQINLRRTAGCFQMPILRKEVGFPNGLVDFKDAMQRNCFDSHVHFYRDDGKFECLWRNPERYFTRLKRFAGIMTPDFSLYTDMPLAMQIWNVFRSRLLGQMLQNAGMKVIPSVSWSDRRSYAFCFDGIPKHGTVSVSSVGIWRDKKFQRLFLRGLEAMIDRTEPAQIAFYGKVPTFDFGKINIKEFQSTTYAWKKKQTHVNSKVFP